MQEMPEQNIHTKPKQAIAENVTKKSIGNSIMLRIEKK
jgi:hypothetical protein